MFKKNKTYSYNTIEEMSQSDYTFAQHGTGSTVGEQFIVLSHGSRDITHSFVLTSYTHQHGYIYECIYTDSEMV